MTLSQALIGETIPPRERARYQGYLAAVMVSSSVFGPVAGGYLTHHFGWRSVFLINLPLGAMAAILVLRLPSRPAREQPWTFDSMGLVLFVGFIVPALLALEQAQRMSASTLPTMLVLAAIAVAALVALVYREKGHPFRCCPSTFCARPPSGAAMRSPPATAPRWWRSSVSCRSICVSCAAVRHPKPACCCCR